jgi:hypothetical protein
MTEPWLGHRDLCSSQWSTWCDCGDVPVDLSETPPEPAWMTTLSGDGDLG